MISPFGLDLIKKFESFRGKEYLDPVGIRTIGFGHVVRPMETIPTEITYEEAVEILKEDVRSREVILDSLISIVIKQHERDALLSFVFNIGLTAFRNSTMRKLLNTGDRVAAAHEFKKWVLAQGKKLPGLVRRRAVEELLFLGVDEKTILYWMEK